MYIAWACFRNALSFAIFDLPVDASCMVKLLGKSVLPCSSYVSFSYLLSYTNLPMQYTENFFSIEKLKISVEKMTFSIFLFKTSSCLEFFI